MRRRRRRPGENERKIRALRRKYGRNAAGRSGPGVNSSAAPTAGRTSQSRAGGGSRRRRRQRARRRRGAARCGKGRARR
eukprot:gene25029-biopygen8982